MENVFEIKDKTGRKIHLSKERWKHITTTHPMMTNYLEEIKETIIKPTLITKHKFDNSMRNYCRYYKYEKCYLLVSVKYLNDEGYIATSFMTRKIIKR